MPDGDDDDDNDDRADEIMEDKNKNDETDHERGDEEEDEDAFPETVLVPLNRHYASDLVWGSSLAHAFALARIGKQRREMKRKGTSGDDVGCSEECVSLLA